MKKPAYLFGPFVGELSWEFFRFAPFMIHTKKENPKRLMIVFTRESRFDLYGNYADILVPLRIPNDERHEKNCFTMNSLLTRDYRYIARTFRSKYKKQYQIVHHYYPDITGWRYRIKWQFPRRFMDYDFKPREKNKVVARQLVKHNNIIVDNNYIPVYKKVEYINSVDLTQRIASHVNNYDTTYLGSMIECLRICRYVIGNLDSDLSHLAILLKKPLICVENKIDMNNIGILNPFNTPIIFADSVEQGVDIYENNI